MKARESGGSLTGILVVDKPAGPTSFDIVRKIKRLSRTRKVGHTGTLDPMATGVLALCLGRATKLVPFLQAGEKEYTGRMILGVSTDTEDITGRILEEKAVKDLRPETVHHVAGEFVGLIEQVPPAYSALKFNGRPAYKLARSGEKVPVRPRMVAVYELTVTDIDPPLVSFYSRVSKGTYIRSLVSDIGRRLGTGACLESLRRLSSAPFSLREALTVEETETLSRDGLLERKLIPPDRALSFMPEVRLPEEMVALVKNGRSLSAGLAEESGPDTGPVRIMSQEGNLLAIYQYNPPTGSNLQECLTPIRVLENS